MAGSAQIVVDGVARELALEPDRSLLTCSARSSG